MLLWGTKLAILNSSIGRKLIIRILLFSSLVTLVGTSAQLYVDYTNEVRSIEKILDQIDVSYIDSLSASLWSFDTEQTQIILNGILKLPNVEYLEIWQEGDVTFVTGHPPNGNKVQKTIPLPYEYRGSRRDLGELVINASLTDVYHRLFKMVLLILSTQAIKTFLVSIFIYLIFHLIVGRHLISLAEYTKQLNLNQLHTPIKLDRKTPGRNDELEILVQSINQMRDNIVSDLKKKQHAEQALEESEIKYRTLFETNSSGVYIYNSNTMLIEDANPAMEKLYGYSRGEIIGMDSRLLMDQQNNPEALTADFHGNKDEKSGQWHKRKDGVIFPVELEEQSILLNSTPFRFANIKDITDRTLAEKKIKNSLVEKETLLKEIHHRVKNNLNVVSSLLSLHVSTTQNEEVRKALLESQGRIFAMSAVHESLYSTESLAEIELINYIQRLFTALIQTYSVTTSKVRMKIEGDKTLVNIKIASPLGLTLNELISNSLKYAFPENSEGEIYISVQRKHLTQIEIIVADNGVGFNKDIGWENCSSLGLKLIRSLIENQLDGSIEVDQIDGTRYTIRFDTKSTID